MITEFFHSNQSCVAESLQIGAGYLSYDFESDFCNGIFDFP